MLKQISLAILVLAFGLHAYHIAHYFFVADDGYIYFRIARHLAEGHGPVWNIGEQVEGYNSIAWLSLLALCFKLGLPLEIMAPALSIVLTGACLITLYRFATRLFTERTLFLFSCGVLFLALNRSWNVWATGGLETRIYTFFMTWAIFEICDSLKLFANPDPQARPELSARHLMSASVLVGLTPMMRMDAFLTGALVITVGLIAHWLYYRPAFAQWIRTSLYTGLPALALVVVYNGFRLWYFGDYLPNTYYAKVGPAWPEMGWRYFRLFAIEYGLLYLFVSGGILFWLHRKSEGKRLRFLAFLAVTILPQLSYYLYKVGGDFFEYWLFDIQMFFLALFVPYMFTLFFRELPERYTRLRGLLARIPATARTVLAALIVAWLSLIHLAIPHWQILTGIRDHAEGQPIWINSRDIVSAEYGVFQYVPRVVADVRNWVDLLYKTQSHMIAKRQEHFVRYATIRIQMYGAMKDVKWPADAVTAESGIGVPGHFLRMPLIDTLGLTDPVIARNPKTLDNQFRLHAHNRIPPEGYLEKRGVNIYAICKTPHRLSSLANFLDHCPYFGDPIGDYDDVFIAPYEGEYLIVRSPRPDWLRERFPGAERLR